MTADQRSFFPEATEVCSDNEEQMVKLLGKLTYIGERGGGGASPPPVSMLQRCSLKYGIDAWWVGGLFVTFGHLMSRIG